MRPKPDLRDGRKDSFETLQQDDPYPRNDARLFRFKKKIKIGDFMAVLLFSEMVLKGGLVDSFDILQDDDLYPWGDARFYRFSKF